MAIISDLSTHIELFPKKYYEKENDPFIYSFFRISKNEKRLLDLYTPLLLKSEYEDIVNNLSLLVENKSDYFFLESVEPLLKIQIYKQSEKYKWIININNINNKDKFDVCLQCNKQEIHQFLNELTNELSNVQSSSYLP